MEAVRILKAVKGPDRKGVPAMSMEKNQIRKTGKKTNRDTSTAADVAKFFLKVGRFTMKYLDWKVVGLSAGTFLSFTYILCVAYDLIFPQHTMYEAWYRLLPGFKWLTWESFFLGLVETFLYGIYAGLVFAPLYNLFNMKLGKL